MSEIFWINLNKLKFVYIFSALLSGVAICVIIIFAFNSNRFPSSTLLVQIFLGALIALPICICIISLSTWFLAHHQQNKFFEKIKDSHLNPLIFVPVIINIENKWKFANHVYQMEEAGSKIILRQNKHQKSEVEFCFFQGENFAEHAIDREVRMTKKEFFNMTTDTIKSIILKTTLS